MKEELKTSLAEAENKEDIEKAISINEKIELIDDKISDIVSVKNKEIVENFLKDTSDGVDGFGFQKTWKMKKRLAPKNTFDPPTAKLDGAGNLITDMDNLEELYLQTYIDRLKSNEIEPHLKSLESLKEYLFELRYNIAKNVVTPDWTMKKLENALKTFKNGKARDAHGHIYELFKYGGRDLKTSILKMFNLIKKKQEYPEILKVSNISSFYKNKGSKSDLNNDRGVFIVVKLRSILDKLIYLDKYETIESNMSDSNIGARKGRNIRDHLFVINGIMNDILKNKNNKKDIELLIYDMIGKHEKKFKQCLKYKYGI